MLLTSCVLDKSCALAGWGDSQQLSCMMAVPALVLSRSMACHKPLRRLSAVRPGAAFGILGEQDD